MLGPVANQRVVELGAGIGRFTGALAATAKSVLAVDFMDNLIAENKKTHGHRCPLSKLSPTQEAPPRRLSSALIVSSRMYCFDKATEYSIAEQNTPDVDMP